MQHLKLLCFFSEPKNSAELCCFEGPLKMDFSLVEEKTSRIKEGPNSIFIEALHSELALLRLFLWKTKNQYRHILVYKDLQKVFHRALNLQE